MKKRVKFFVYILSLTISGLFVCLWADNKGKGREGGGCYMKQSGLCMYYTVSGTQNIKNSCNHNSEYVKKCPAKNCFASCKKEGRRSDTITYYYKGGAMTMKNAEMVCTMSKGVFSRKCPNTK